ncbi:MAG: SPOR domain-containing protein [Pseudomonadota bacterium]|nr:SPOR domain-containing protein [Pseudomonadota bacterium]
MNDNFGAEDGVTIASSKSLEQSGFGSRRRRVMAIMIGVSVILGFGVLALYVHNKSKHEERSGVPPVIQPEDGPSKVRPKNPGGLKVPNQDKDVFSLMDPDSHRPRAELLGPKPEKPVETPSTEIPKRHNNQSLWKPDIKTGLQRTQKGDPEAKTAGPGPKPKTGYDLQVEKKPGSGKLKPAPNAGYRVQIASLRSENSVRENWSALGKRHKDLLGKLSLFIERKKLGGRRGVYYRMQAGTFETRDEARRLCRELKGLKLECIVVKQ